MKERPILFSSAMIRAILDGRKTQTRRVIKPQPRPNSYHDAVNHRDGIPFEFGFIDDKGLQNFQCPYGQPGDHLCVKETIGRRAASFLGIEATNGVKSAFYKADDAECVNEDGFNLCPWWKGPTLPSIFMPRWASRITLDITGVRVERVCDISEEDASAEGVDNTFYPMVSVGYMHLWDKINGKKHPWSSNPWVWVIDFQRTEAR